MISEKAECHTRHNMIMSILYEVSRIGTGAFLLRYFVVLYS